MTGRVSILQVDYYITVSKLLPSVVRVIDTNPLQGGVLSYLFSIFLAILLNKIRRKRLWAKQLFQLRYKLNETEHHLKIVICCFPNKRLFTVKKWWS